MKVPVSLRIAALAVATTGFYAYVGQLVPQKEVLPPAEVALSKDMTADQMRKAGREIMEGKGLCLTCHTIGKKGGPFRFPDLDGIGARASHRVAGLDDVHYIAQSMYEPSKFIVPGYNPGMPVINKPPIGLSDDEILTVIAYLQSLGGTTTVTMQTKLPWQTGGGAAEGTSGVTTTPGASGSTIAPVTVPAGPTGGSNAAAAEPATAAAPAPGNGTPPPSPQEPR